MSTNKSRVVSTRGKDSANLDEAILLGLARDGGLFVPVAFPILTIADFYAYKELSEFAQHLIAPFFAGSSLIIDKSFCEQVFNFPLHLKALSETHHVLELFHGPTLSFKDFGARFFAQCLEQLNKGKVTKVLVATSGDTGSAVASALSGKQGIEGFILFPQGKISQRQEAQITCWESNIHALAVHGTFDHCQALVKQAFAENLTDGWELTTANSINIARLLPQVLFYAYSSIQLTREGQGKINFIVPSGNLGNVTACYWAKALGFPIGQILIATNENSVLSHFLESGHYQPQASIKTLANAMDVGDPSNLERLLNLFPDFAEFKKQLDVLSVSDEKIKIAITNCYKENKYLICPHTATAYSRLQNIKDDQIWVIVATAHPAKFEEVIEPLLEIEIPIPNQLADLLKREKHSEVIDPEFSELKKHLTKRKTRIPLSLHPGYM